MKIATSLRLANRTLTAYRHRALLQPCSLLSARVNVRGYTTTKNTGNGGNANENTADKKATTENTTEGKAAGEAPSELQTQMAKLKEELEESKRETLIAIADRQTGMRIAKDDVRKAKEYGIQKLAVTLLDVNDILERALESVQPEKLVNNPDLQNFFEGVKMTEKLLLKAYEQNDIKRFHPIGQKFDPNLHQALQEVVDPTKEIGTVYYVMKAGYQLKDRLLRAASVAVVKADPNSKPAAGEKKDEPAVSS